MLLAVITQLTIPGLLFFITFHTKYNIIYYITKFPLDGPCFTLFTLQLLRKHFMTVIETTS